MPRRPDVRMDESTLSRPRRVGSRRRAVDTRPIDRDCGSVVSLSPRRQAREVLGRFDLAGRVQLFQRCPVCNGALHSVPKADILTQLEPLTRQHYEEFWRCPACGKIYWRGAHYPRLGRKLERILGNVTNAQQP